MVMIAVGGLIFLASAGAVGAMAPEVYDRPYRSTYLPRPRDGNIAVQEELDAARRAGTVEAFDLFLARHGNHPLAAPARRERARIAARTGK